MVVGRPGAGKSLFALYAALNSGVRTLYISADTDQRTMAYRAAASLMGEPVNTVQSMVGTSGQDMVEEALAKVDDVIGFDWTSSPTLRDLELEVHAAEETWGDYPSLIIIDSVYNVVTDEGDDWSGMRQVVSAAHTLARNTSAHVMLLHHASLNRSKEDEPAGMGAVLGQVTQIPELILSVMLDEEDRETYRVGIVKNRSDAANSKGSHSVRLAVDVPRMRLYSDLSELRLAQKAREWE